MATEKEIKKFIESKYNFDVLENGVYKLVMDGDDGRSQLVFVEVTDTWLNVFSPFANMDDVTPKQALTANSDYILGMQTLGDTYCVKYVVLIADLDENELVDGIEFTASIADRLEADLVGGDKF